MTFFALIKGCHRCLYRDNLFTFARIYEITDNFPLLNGNPGTEVSIARKDEFKKPEGRITSIQ